MPKETYVGSWLTYSVFKPKRLLDGHINKYIAQVPSSLPTTSITWPVLAGRKPCTWYCCTRQLFILEFYYNSVEPTYVASSLSSFSYLYISRLFN